MFASLFVIIVLFPFIFIYTCSFEFIVMSYLIYVMFLFVGHNDLSAMTGAVSCGATRLGEAEEEAHVEQVTPRSTRPMRSLSRSRTGHRSGMVMRRVHRRGRPTAIATDQLHVSRILILFRFIFV
jgi:hypothetical protein